MKVEPVGVCDLCKGPIDRRFWYTSKGRPRCFCSRDCRNTANSRAGIPVRREKTLKRVAAGTWKNPAKLRPPTPEEQSERARKGRLREVTVGTWRNPALTDQARVKLSRPRRHDGVIHSALEKLKQGGRIADLTTEEQEAHRAYRRDLRAQRKNAGTIGEIHFILSPGDHVTACKINLDRKPVAVTDSRRVTCGNCRRWLIAHNIIKITTSDNGILSER